MNKSKIFHIGIDLGGTKIEGILLQPQFVNSAELQKHIILRRRISTASEQGYQHILNRTTGFIRSLIHDCPEKCDRFTIGVGLPGHISRLNKTVKNSNTTCLNGKRFWQDIENRLKRQIVFENDANCFALAEAIWGAGANYRSLFGVILGTGVGGGFIHNKQIISGAQNIAGEWGHTLLIPGGNPCYCGKQGCVETYLSGKGFEQNILHPLHFDMSARSFNHSWQIGALCRKEEAEQAVEIYCDYFGMALSNVINIIDPEVVILGGGMSNCAFLYTKGVDAVRKYVFNDEMLTKIKPAVLSDAAGVFGAAYLGAKQTSLA